MTQYKIEGTRVVENEVAPMLTSRASFGCTLNVHDNEIYVLGGYSNGVATRSCEAYNIEKNEWRQLPPLSEEKCAMSVSVMGGRYLYCIGGFTKPQDAGSATLLTTIEVLDLLTPGAQWVTLSLRLPQAVCDMGSVPISKQ